MLADKPFILVLEEDGTNVETEDYFQALGEYRVHGPPEGQKWQPASEQVGTSLPLHKPAKKIDVLNPQDFIGCLNEACRGRGKGILPVFHWSCLFIPPREALRWALFSMQATGHVLLGSSCYLRQLLDATEGERPPKGRASSLIPTRLKILQ
uniref:Cell death inducing DFFA like effector c n=1 Tax=Microcebus murinus TaxID=30608 RepID=A0A8C5VNZ0_MICMU